MSPFNIYFFAEAFSSLINDFNLAFINIKRHISPNNWFFNDRDMIRNTQDTA